MFAGGWEPQDTARGRVRRRGTYLVAINSLKFSKELDDSYRQCRNYGYHLGHRGWVGFGGVEPAGGQGKAHLGPLGFSMVGSDILY